MRSTKMPSKGYLLGKCAISEPNLRSSHRSQEQRSKTEDVLKWFTLTLPNLVIKLLVFTVKSYHFIPNKRILNNGGSMNLRVALKFSHTYFGNKLKNFTQSQMSYY